MGGSSPPPNIETSPQEFSATPAVKLKIMDFLKFQFLTIGTVNRVELHHRAKFRQNRSYCGRDMAIFRFFKMAPPPSWIFKILTAGTVKGFEMHQRAKFRENRLNRGRNTAILSIFQDGGRRHLGFLKFQIFLEKSKNRHFSAAVQPILTKFGAMMQIDPTNRPEG